MRVSLPFGWVFSAFRAGGNSLWGYYFSRYSVWLYLGSYTVGAFRSSYGGGDYL